MNFTLESFAGEVRKALQSDPSPAGREKVRALVEEALRDESFIKSYINDNTPERQVIYEDPELGFCVCAHVNHGAREANPHDHGPSWAIYGQAQGKTTMTEWKVVRPRTGDKPAVVEPEKVYDLNPGMAALYEIGHVHSPSRTGPTRLIRIEGENLDHVRRDAYVAAEMAR